MTGGSLPFSSWSYELELLHDLDCRNLTFLSILFLSKASVE